MQRAGVNELTSNSSGQMPATDDEIKEKYLERAIRELNDLCHELQQCNLCQRGSLMPILGSGHPQADIMMVKYAPVSAEIEEGVAFYGRAGSALMKSLKRLAIDPLAVYGTLCVKCPVSDSSLAAEECIGRLAKEFAIVDPHMVVMMGDEAVAAVNELQLPLAKEIEPDPGVVQKLTPTAGALVTPSIDDCLDDRDAKQRFWLAFKELGKWYSDQPPY